MTSTRRPRWQLPPGVSHSLWDYTESHHVAADYDNYFRYHRLLELDQHVLARHAPSCGTIVDLGCGTGRALIPLMRPGIRGIAVDLSWHMLEIVQQKASAAQVDITPVRCNMVQLDWIPDATVDLAMCMFSSLGMVQGAVHRATMLAHVRRMLRPDGKFVLHVHNFWFNLRDPGGPWWAIRNVLHAALLRNIERGDRFFPYRGIPNMFLHVFTRRELLSALHKAGFRILEWLPLDPTRQRRLRHSWFVQDLRANGWIVVAGPAATFDPHRCRDDHVGRADPVASG